MEVTTEKDPRKHVSQWGRKFRKDNHIHQQIEPSPENVYNIMKILLEPNSSTGVKNDERLHLMNVLMTCFKKRFELDPKSKISKELLFCFFRKFLTSNHISFREATFRALRHLIKMPSDLLLFNSYFYPNLVVKSIDITLEDNFCNRELALDLEHEKAQIFKLIRKIVLVANGDSTLIHISIVRSILSLAGSIYSANKSTMTCVLILTEIAILNSDLFIDLNGISVLTRYLLSCPSTQVAESICVTILYLLNEEQCRNRTILNLVPLISSFCDFNKISDDLRSKKLNCSQRIIFTILKSWPGFVYFCDPTNVSGVKSIIDSLLLDQIYVQIHVMDLFYELLEIEVPEWTDEFSVALSAIDNTKLKSVWRLNEKFIIGESDHFVPHLAKNALNIIEIHRSLLLSAFLKANLVDNLVEVIINFDKFLAVRATILLGFVLHYARLLLPKDYQPDYLPLSKLLNAALSGNVDCLAVVSTLNYLQRIFNEKRIASSIFLHKLLKQTSNLSSSDNMAVVRMSSIDKMFKKCGIKKVNDYFLWDWDLIEAILKNLKGLKTWTKDSKYQLLLKKLVNFFKPSNKKYSQMDNDHSKPIYNLVAFDLIDCLATYSNDNDHGYLMELFTDILNEVNNCLNSKNIHNCLFSPKNMMNKFCHYYFIFTQHAYQYDVAAKIINVLDIWNKMADLAVSKNNDCYLKLLLASLNYNEAISIQILKRILKVSTESFRLYSIKFLKILMRIQVNNFHEWGMDLLIEQLADTSIKIVNEAVQVLCEACYNDLYLNFLLENWHKVTEISSDHFTETKHLIFAKVLSLENSLQCLDVNDVVAEIRIWCQKFCKSYTLLMEAEIHRGFMSSCSYDLDNSEKLPERNTRDIYIKNHLFGSLSQYEEGYNLLMENSEEFLTKSSQILINNQTLSTYDELLELKTVLWMFGHLARSSYGIQYLTENHIVEEIIAIVENHSVFSVRGTAYYALCIVATTPIGSDYLETYNWVSIRYGRLAFFPLCLPPHDVVVDYNLKKNSSDIDIKNKWNLNVVLNVQYNGASYPQFENVSKYCCLESKQGTKFAQLPTQHAGFCLPGDFQKLFQIRSPYTFEILSSRRHPEIDPMLMCGHTVNDSLKCCSYFIHNGLSKEDYNLRLSIIKSVVILANPIFENTSRQYLLELRQQHSEFCDIFVDNFCLYASVCWNLAQVNYQFTARQFIQGLFFDNKLTVINDDVANKFQEVFVE